MSDVFDLARESILGASDIGMADLEQTLGNLMTHSIDYGEVYLQAIRSESWGLEDGIVKDGSFAVDAGIGVRALSGEKTGFAYSDDMLRDGLEQAASAARTIARRGEERQPVAVKRTDAPALYPAVNPMTLLDEVAKVRLLQRIDQVARQADTRVKEVNVRISANHDVMMAP